MEKPVFIFSFFSNVPRLACDYGSREWAVAAESEDGCGLNIIRADLPSHGNASLIKQIIEYRPLAKRLKILWR